MALSSSFSQEVKTNREAITIKEVLNIFFISESNYVKVDFDQDNKRKLLVKSVSVIGISVIRMHSLSEGYY